MRVVIAEDSVLLREGVIRLLSEFGFEVVAAAGDAPELIQAIDVLRPEVAICDVRMPPTYSDEGIRAAVEIRERWPETAVLVLSQYVEERYAVDLIANDTSGVGYLLKDRVSDVADFVEAVRRVGNGGTALDPEVVKQLLVRGRHREPLNTLTDREQHVLRLMAEGRTNSAIATELVVSDSAVEKHVSSIFTKLGLLPGDTDHRRVLAVLRFLGAGREGR